MDKVAVTFGKKCTLTHYQTIPLKIMQSNLAYRSLRHNEAQKCKAILKLPKTNIPFHLAPIPLNHMTGQKEATYHELAI